MERQGIAGTLPFHFSPVLEMEWQGIQGTDRPNSLENDGWQGEGSLLEFFSAEVCNELPQKS